MVYDVLLRALKVPEISETVIDCKKSCVFFKHRTEVYDSSTGVLESRCFASFDNNVKMLKMSQSILIKFLVRLPARGATATIMLYSYQSESDRYGLVHDGYKKLGPVDIFCFWENVFTKCFLHVR